MLVSCLGVPHSGHDALARRLAEHRSLEVVDHASLRQRIESSSSASASAARKAVRTGQLVEDATVGLLLAELVASRRGRVVLVGYPRTVIQLETLEAKCGDEVWVVHVSASAGLIDERRAKLGLPPVRAGQLAAAEAARAPLLAEVSRRGRLLTLEATMDEDEMLATADGISRGAV